LSLDEFRRAFPEEGPYVEFKTGMSRTQLQETVVAFSNADGGIVLIGIADDGEILGRRLDAGTEDAIHQIMRDVHDPGRYSIHDLLVEGRPLTVLSVARREDGFSQVSNGVVRVRKGTRDEALFGAELQHFINARAATRYELMPTRLPTETADPGLLDALASAFGWSGPDLDERLMENGFATEGRLTVAGALYLLPKPGDALGKAHIEVLRYRDDKTVNYDRRVSVEGPLAAQLENAVRLLEDELGTELVVLGARRYELPRLPAVVIREAVANAIAHRSYELNRTPVRISIRPSSVVIVSPGGLPEPVTVENIREASAPRNIEVIKALRYFGLAEDAGRGIDVMEDTMLEEMLDPPRFEDRGHEVVVTLPVRSAVAPDERAWIRELERRGTVAGRDRLLLVHAARGETLTNARARAILQADRSQAREALQRLRDAGFLVQRGERGGATYELESSLAPPAGLRLGTDELARLVEELAAEGPVTNTDVRVATGLDRADARALLARLVGEGRLTQSGQKRGTRYRRPTTKA
jgi:ATP-dependent DNA helicase RecG